MENEKYFNEKEKLLFLDDPNMTKYNRNNYDYIFRNTKQIEEKFGKDIYEFGYNNGMDILKLFEPFSSGSQNLKNVRSKLIKYVEFFRPYKVKINFIKSLKPKDLLTYYEKDKEEFVLLNKKQIEQCKRNMTKNINNIDDRNYHLALFLCQYYGISGEKYKEISEMRVSDIDIENGIIKLYNNRVVSINLEFQNLLLEASKVYFNSRGVPYNIYKYPDQVFRFLTYSKTQEDYTKIAKIRLSDIYFRKIKKTIDMPKNVNIDVIYRSGMVNYVYERAIEDGIDLKEDLKNNDNTHINLYEKYLSEFGSRMTFYNFKYAYGNWILKNL